MVDESELRPSNNSKETLLQSHLVYADDMMTFCKVTQTNAKNIVKFLNYYREILG